MKMNRNSPAFGHSVYEGVVDRLLESAIGSIADANMACCFGSGYDDYYTGNKGILAATHAGEMVIKAIIAQHHPLLIFRNIFDFKGISNDLSLEKILERGVSHDFKNLPKILWAVTGQEISDMHCFDIARKYRNSVQHFFHPDGMNHYGGEVTEAAFKFLYSVVDPLLFKNFDTTTIDIHSDQLGGFDYISGPILSRQFRFSMPENFDMDQDNFAEAIKDCDISYKVWLKDNLVRIENSDLIYVLRSVSYSKNS